MLIWAPLAVLFLTTLALAVCEKAPKLMGPLTLAQVAYLLALGPWFLANPIGIPDSDGLNVPVVTKVAVMRGTDSNPMLIAKIRRIGGLNYAIPFERDLKSGGMTETEIRKAMGRIARREIIVAKN